MSHAIPSRRAVEDVTTARTAAGLTAALLATRIMTAPRRHPRLVAAAAGLVTASPDEPAGDRGVRSRALRAARGVLLPWARQLLAPLAGASPWQATASWKDRE